LHQLANDLSQYKRYNHAKGIMTDTPQIITIPATELNLRAGNVLRRVAVDREHIIIERNGYPIAVMIPIHDYQLFVKNQTSDKITSNQKL
jgi:prevent-host-death family protein